MKQLKIFFAPRNEVVAKGRIRLLAKAELLKRKLPGYIRFVQGELVEDGGQIYVVAVIEVISQPPREAIAHFTQIMAACGVRPSVWRATIQIAEDAFLRSCDLCELEYTHTEFRDMVPAVVANT